MEDVGEQVIAIHDSLQEGAVDQIGVALHALREAVAIIDRTEIDVPGFRLAHDQLQNMLGTFPALTEAMGSISIRLCNREPGQLVVPSPEDLPPAPSLPEKEPEAAAAAENQQTQEQEAETSGLISIKEAAALLGIHRVTFEQSVMSQLPVMTLVTGSKLIDAAAVQALAASQEWRDRSTVSQGARQFSQSDTGQQAAADAVSGFETKIDEQIRKYGNGPIPNQAIVETLNVSHGAVQDWKEKGPLQGQGVGGGKEHGVPAHTLYGLYSWQTPESASPGDTPSDSQPEAGQEPPDQFMTRPEAAKALGISVSGFQKTEQHLHHIQLASGAKRFSRRYIEALQVSGVLRNTSQPTRASSEFAKTPEAARAIFEAEKELGAQIESATTPDGQSVEQYGLMRIFKVTERTVRNWISAGHILQKHRDPQSQDIAYVNREDVNDVYYWGYPKGYPRPKR